MKRPIAKLVLFLVLGAIVNVAVAWGCVALVAFPRWPSGGAWFHVGDPPCWEYQCVHAFGACRIQSNPTGLFAVVMSEPTPESHALPKWSRICGRPGEENTTIEDGRGWPVICLSSEMVFQDFDEQAGWVRTPDGSFHLPERWLVNGGVRIQDAQRSDEIVVLPLYPVWLGFAINTIFYAAILWLLFAAPGRVRRWRRVKRGLCPACAYPVGKSAICTECGKLIAVEGVAPT